MDIKKILLILLILLIGTASAMDWDNDLDYEDNDMKVIITNWLGFGEKLGEVTLTSHSTTTEIRNVIAGKNRAVMYYDFKDWERYENGLGEVYFTNEKTGLLIEKEYYFAEAVYHDVEVPTYEKVCKIIISKNESNDYESCANEINGTKIESQFKEWKKLTTKNIPNYDVRIALIIDVQGGEKVDGVWTIAGKKVKRHAVWQDSYNTGLVSYWKLNETSGDAIDSVGGSNGNVVQITQGVSGKIGTAYNFSETNGVNNFIELDETIGNALGDNYAGNFSFSMWVNPVNPLDDGLFQFGGNITLQNSLANAYIQNGRLGLKLNYSGWERYSTELTERNWVYYTFVYVANSETDTKIYMNGTEVTGTTTTGTFPVTTDMDFLSEVSIIGGYYDKNHCFEGVMDEFAFWNRSLSATEILDMYNSGDGMTYIDIVEAENPQINITSPINNSITPDINIDVEYTRSDDAGIDSCWYSNGTYQVNTTLVDCGNITDVTWSYGTKNITIWVNDTSNKINSSQVIFKVQVDATSPTISPAYNLTNQSVFILPVNSTWNYTVSDTSLESCWYNTTDNATITLITCNSTIYTQWDTQGDKTIWYYVNDTSGNENSLSKTINIGLLSVDKYHNPDSIGELGNVNFELYVNFTQVQDRTAYLFINNTIYYPDNTNEYDNYTYFNYSLIVPDGWGNTTGLEHDYYWNYTILGFVENQTTTDNVTIYAMAIDDCSSYGIVILNLTLNDEEDNDYINASNDVNVEIDLQISKGSTTWIYNQTWTENNASVCIPNGVLNNTNYTIDFTIGFDSTDHVSEFYFLDDGVLSNNNLNYFNSLTLKDIILMDLATADSTSFLFNYLDLDGLVVEDIIIHVFRKYIGEGVFREVERAKQNEGGDTIVHLVEEDVIYYFIISQYGTTLFTSSTYTALCQTTPCEIQLEESGGFQEFDEDWDLIDNGAYTLTSNTLTREVTLNYSLTTPSTMNLTVYKLISDGSYESVGSEEATSKSGSLTITVPVVSGNTSFFASAYQDGNFKTSQWIDFEEDAGLYFGNVMALFLGALIILTLGLMAVTEGSAVIVFLILGMFIAMVLGLVDYRASTSFSILMYFILAGGIILYKLTRRTR